MHCSHSKRQSSNIGRYSSAARHSTCTVCHASCLPLILACSPLNTGLHAAQLVSLGMNVLVLAATGDLPEQLAVESVMLQYAVDTRYSH